MALGDIKWSYTSVNGDYSRDTTPVPIKSPIVDSEGNIYLYTTNNVIESIDKNGNLRFILYLTDVYMLMVDKDDNLLIGFKQSGDLQIRDKNGILLESHNYYELASVTDVVFVDKQQNVYLHIIITE